MMKKHYRFKILLAAFVLLVAILAFKAWKENNSLQKHKKLTAATITSTSESFTGARQLRFYYSYSVNQTLYTSQILVKEPEAIGERNAVLFNHRDFHFPVIYNSLHPKINKILITSEDWIKYGITLIDSLRKQYTVIEPAP